MDKVIISHCIDSSSNGAGVAEVFNQLKKAMHFNPDFHAFDNKQIIIMICNIFTFRSSPLSSIIKNCTLLHLHDLWSITAIFLILFTRPANVILSPHGMLDDYAMRKSFYRKLFLISIYRFFSYFSKFHFHCLTEVEARQVRTLFKAKNIFVIPNGVPLQKQLDATRPKEILRFIFLSRIHPKKGLDKLLCFASKLHIANLEFEMKIHGFGQEYYMNTIKEKISSLGLQSKVSLEDPIYGNQKFSALRRSDYLVLPSLSEGLPLAILEAWSVGTPTLHTKECNLDIGFSEKASIDFDSLHSFPFVEDWFHFLHERKKLMRINAFELCREHFNLQTITQKHIQNYDELSRLS